jgi:hypothetical protein
MHEDISNRTLNFIIASALSNALFRAISVVITSLAVICICVHKHCNILTQIYSPHKRTPTKMQTSASSYVVSACAA